MHLWCQFKKKTPGPVVEPRWCFWLSPVPIHEKLYGDLDGPETYGCVLQRYPSGRLKVFNEEEFTGDFCHPPPWFNHRVLALGDTPLLLCWAWSCHGIYKQKLKTPPNDKYSLHNTSVINLLERCLLWCSLICWIWEWEMRKKNFFFFHESIFCSQLSGKPKRWILILSHFQKLLKIHLV